MRVVSIEREGLISIYNMTEQTVSLLASTVFAVVGCLTFEDDSHELKYLSATLSDVAQVS